MENKVEDFSLDYFSLKGKVALVTGGTSGIGQAFIVALAKAGADIFVPTLNSNWEETKKLVENENRKVFFLQTDISKKENAKNVVSECIKEYGKIDILVNNAGTIRRANILEYEDSDWQDVIDLNLNSVFYLMREASKFMADAGHGKIINVASLLAFQGGKFVPSYTASKHGVVGLTKSFANELAMKNIQVNAIAPGYIQTRNTKQLRENEERFNEILERIPAARWGDTLDLMGAVVFLASKASDYMNGHVLCVDGGWLAR